MKNDLKLKNMKIVYLVLSILSHRREKTGMD